MKKYFRILLGIFTMSSIMTSCGEGIVINGSGGSISAPDSTMDCIWDNVTTAVFLDANLLSPCSNGECDYQFANSRLADVLNSWSIYNIMYACCYGQLAGCPFDFKWTVTAVAEDNCSVEQEQSRHIIATQDDFQHVFTQYYQDIIESPCMSAIPSNQHKHKFELQIHEIENEHDQTIGSIKWENTWLSPTAEFNNEWWFTFPQGEIIGKYEPNSYQPVTRHIYINGQYADI